jgi:hypothetical protein
MYKSLLSKNMRNKIKFISVLSALSLLMSFAPALAEDSGTTTTPPATNTGGTGRQECRVVEGKQVCVRTDGGTKPTTLSDKQKALEEQKLELEDKLKEHRQARIDHEKQRIEGLYKLVDNQISRSQKELDRMSVLIDRIKAQRAKLTAATTSTGDTATSTAPAISSTDLAKVDDMITKAETLKKKIETDIADAKTKEAALVGSAKKVEDTINTETSTTAPVVNTAAPTPVIQSVKDFQASMKVLKKDLITLHTSLQDIVKAMRKLAKRPEADATKPEETKPTNGQQENETND